MKVGCAQIEITPDIPFPRGGHWNPDVMASTFLDHLYASCVAIDDGDKVVIMISCDLGMIKDDVLVEIGNQIHERTGVVQEHLLISATHNHQNPRFAAINPVAWIDPDPEIRNKIVMQIVQSAETALSRLKPAKMGLGKGNVGGCAFNRRYIYSDGRSNYHNVGRRNPDRLMVEGPVDDEVEVIWFEDMEGDHLGIIVNFASHPTVLIGTDYVSADYPGSMRKVIQGVLGKPIPVLLLQGSSGNIGPMNMEDPNPKQGAGLDAYHRIGRILGGEVIKIISENYASDLGQSAVDIENKVIHVPFREITEAELKQSEQNWLAYSDDDKQHPTSGKQARKMLIDYSTCKLFEQKQACPYLDLHISLLRIGDVYVITNPCELYVEYQLEIKREFPGDHVMVVELTNGYAGYIPTLQAFALGGGDTERSMMSMLAPEAGEMIVTQSLELLNNEYGKMQMRKYNSEQFYNK